MLFIRKLNQYYGQSHTLWDIDLDVARGECVCVMGRNGVGKSTLLRAVMGLVTSASGSIRLDGRELAGTPVELRVRSGIAYVPQGRQIFPRLTVEENLRLGLSAGRSKHISDRIFGLFPVLKSMLGRRGGDLSGGQQQQLAIARALVLSPSLLILDEPTEGIQPNVVEEIANIVQRLREEESLTVLLVEQKLPFARRVAQRFFLMDRGRMVASGGMVELDDDLVDRHVKV
ncbi:MAG: urea ABC transporter ATP-binding subunit UrtE [Proteobacteria bacterium]|nr:urea ABC transporter ATP-binding subunit UrtE [Pseudomonadota bacterium]